MVLSMRTYDETYERIMVKKAVAEKEIRARNKKIATSVTAVSCFSVCIVALFALSKARVNVNPDKDNVPDIYQPVTSTNDVTEDAIVTTTFTETPNASVSVRTEEDITTPSPDGYEPTSFVGDSAGQNGDVATTYTELDGTHEYIDSPHLTAEERENYRMMYVRCAMCFVDKEDYSKIDIDKSYMEKVIKDVNGEKYLLMHLEGDTFYYEVIITTRCAETYGVKRISK